MKNNRSLKLTQELIEKHQLSTQKPPEDSLFWHLWNSNLDIANQALETDFVQGIKSGTLDPVKYGGFNISDAYYCFHGAEDYAVAAEKAENPVLKAFLNQKYESYAKYNDTFPDTWHVKNGDGIVPLDICKEYSDFESGVVKTADSIYCLIVMLPCEYLWAWLGGQLAPASASNLYAPWITGNNDPSGAYAMGNFIELYRKEVEIDVSFAKKIYAQAMDYEFQNFRAATEGNS